MTSCIFDWDIHGQQRVWNSLEENELMQRKAKESEQILQPLKLLTSKFKGNFINPWLNCWILAILCELHFIAEYTYKIHLS